MPKSVINNRTEENIKNYLSEEDNNGNSMSDLDGKNEKKHSKNKKLILMFFLLLIISIAVLFYFMRNKGKESFDNTQVKIRIEAPEEIMSGDEIAFNIHYENNTSVNLKNVKISFYLPQNFLYISSERENEQEQSVLSWKMNKISAGEIGNIKMFGRVLGNKDSVYEFKSKILYTPENFNYQFSSSDDFSNVKTIIKKVPFDLVVQSPEILTRGDEFEYVIDFKNTSNYAFETLHINSDLSENFICNSENAHIIDKERGNYLTFDIKNFKADAIGKIFIKCNVTKIAKVGDDSATSITLEASEDGKKFFEYVKKDISTIIEKVPIEIEQKVNNSSEYLADKGEDLEYVIKFKNVSDKEIRGLVINDKLSGKVNLNSIVVDNGSYDKNLNKITWSAFNVPKLASFAPGDEGEVRFHASVDDYIEIKNSEEKHLSINSAVTVSHFNFISNSIRIEKKIASNDNITKLNASLFIRSKGYFNDDGRIKNIGAIPPEVGKETNYLIHWNLSNLFNDISSIRITSILPENINWTGNFIKSNGKISIGNQDNGTFTPLEDSLLNKKIGQTEDKSSSVDNIEKDSQSETKTLKEEKFYYNTKTREVIWEIPLLDANTGVLSPVKEVVFQVSTNPKESDIGSILDITGIVTATGYDNFTNQEINAIDIALTSELPDDYSIGVNEGVVVANFDLEEKRYIIIQ